ncbi:MAG TPA: PQQ-binding-like beta-propeller repeat protein [Planctomycetota bacterium]|nr:PQQ-binding-like beta-propeller repeat protein [Planctomycetota bacterium]
MSTVEGLQKPWIRVLLALGLAWTVSSASVALAPEPPASKSPAGFRGDGSGFYPESHPPAEWGEKKNVKWRTRVGKGYSSPVVSHGCLYVASDPPELACIDAATGVIRWKVPLKSSDLPPDLQTQARANENVRTSCGYAAPTPVADESRVFALFGTGLVACFSHDGKRQWLRQLDPAKRNYGHSSSPLLVADRLLVNVHHLTGLDPETGAIVWNCPEAGESYGTPVRMKLGETEVVVTPLGVVVRARDGVALAREIAEDLGGDEYGISPVASGDIVYLGDRNTSAVRLELRGDRVLPKKLWSVEMPNAAYASPVVGSGLYFYVGKLAEYSVLDAVTGATVLERLLQLAPAGGEDKDHGNANVYPSLYAADGRLFISNDVGQTFVLEAGRVYREIARNALPEGSGSTPAIAGSSLYIRAGEDLYCIEK